MHVVTGAFGYIGRYVARGLLERGESVRTITTHVDKPNPFGPSVEAFPYSFDDPAALTRSLRGATTLFNTYWVRFDHGDSSFEKAVRNTETLFRCAREAGVSRIVQVSVTRCSLDSPLPYYRGKARQEEALRASGVPFSIVRPTLVFGREDVLVNNVAWLLRTFPVFPIFWPGACRVQPVYVEDLATLAVDEAFAAPGRTFDAIGPETFTLEDLVRRVARAVRSRAVFLRVPPRLGLAAGRLVGLFLGDVVLTRDELRGLADEMLTSDEAPNAPTLFTEWVAAHRDEVGAGYTSEMARHFRWRGGGEKERKAARL
ncbi:MAG: NAD(P)H-binding protein [Thermoanaerobaculia bacterium]|nr:NAD(P)H-binding protein [Thermoanaerobaculia bacterium]